MKRSLVAMSWILCGLGTFFLIRETSALTAIAILLLLWGNNVYESAKRSD